MLLWNAGLWRHRVATTSLLLSDVILVCESLLLLHCLRHVARVHLRIALRHSGTGLLRREMLRGRFFGGFDSSGIINAVFTTAGRFGSVQASLVILINTFSINRQ